VHADLYKELLPELRKKFSGELAVFMFYGRVSNYLEEVEIPEYDYSGFDYITPICPPALLTDSQ
jgi:hypothetical protein